MVTTAEAFRQETAYLAVVRDGKGRAAPLLAREIAKDALKDAARSHGLKLTAGQAKAAVEILASDERVVHVQGNAGTGKSAMLTPVARLVEADGRKVIGLAVSNAIANRLRAEVGIDGGTVAGFLRTHRSLLSPTASSELREASRASLRGALVIVDEASMLSTHDAGQLVAIANAAEVGRLALIGDTKQLGAVEAGKPFSLGQDAATAVMDQNLRAKTPEMRELHHAAQAHDIHRLVQLIEPHTTEAPGNAAETAARMWMQLSPSDRARTAIFVSGRALRAAVNHEVQTLRLEAGELGAGATITGTLLPVHLTREEQKLARSYQAGQVIELSRPLTSQGLPEGRMEVIEVGKNGEIGVRLPSGLTATFRPDRLAGNRVDDAVAVFEQRDIQIHEGDPIRWTANDRDRGLVNSERATFETRQQDALIFRLADNQTIRLERNDPMLKRIDLAYATNAHAAQGATADRAILVARSTEGALINRSLVGVLFTRAREHISLVVDSMPSFERRAQVNIGEKTAAVEIASASRAPPLVPQLTLPERQLDTNSGGGKAPERERDISFGM
ncbi:MAG: AAA family ATPase [Hyphomicrobium sp.]|nr:AAA family ATPase [Hyphomicrobium sp.]